MSTSKLIEMWDMEREQIERDLGHMPRYGSAEKKERMYTRYACLSMCIKDAQKEVGETP